MKIIKKSILLCSCILFILPLLTGCWDRLEIEDRANILGISIDSANSSDEEQGEEVTHLSEDLNISNQDLIRVSVQIALPGRIPLGPGGDGGGGGSSQQTVWVLSSVGHTLAEALVNLQQQVSAKFFLGHLRIVVISDEVARRGLENINSYLRRNSEIRTNTWMVVSKGPAEDLMKAAPPLERVPTLYLLSTLEEGVKMGKIPKNFLALFWSNLSKKGQEGFLTYLEKEVGDNIKLAGLCFFKNDQMVGVIDPIEVIGYMGIKGINPAGYSVVINAPGTQGTVTLYSTKRISKTNVSIESGWPRFTVHTFIELNLSEKSKKDIHINQETIKQIEDEMAKELRKEYQDLISKTQEVQSDIFGFGELVRAKESRYWDQQIKTKEKWQELYKDIAVEIKVIPKIRRVGMTVS